MRAQLRIVMLIQRRAVKTGQAPEVLGKMRGNPIQNNAYPGLMAGINKKA
jgi:hypothetical protein